MNLEHWPVDGKEIPVKHLSGWHYVDEYPPICGASLYGILRTLIRKGIVFVGMTLCDEDIYLLITLNHNEAGRYRLKEDEMSKFLTFYCNIKCGPKINWLMEGF